ncbi:MAG: hypothetical protein ABGY32_01570 [bacterium]
MLTHPILPFYMSFLRRTWPLWLLLILGLLGWVGYRANGEALQEPEYDYVLS